MCVFCFSLFFIFFGVVFSLLLFSLVFGVFINAAMRSIHIVGDDAYSLFIGLYIYDMCYCYVYLSTYIFIYR